MPCAMVLPVDLEMHQSKLVLLVLPHMLRLSRFQLLPKLMLWWHLLSHRVFRHLHQSFLQFHQACQAWQRLSCHLRYFRRLQSLLQLRLLHRS